MTDQCKFCEFRGDFDACILAACGHHDNWIALQHKERAESLLAQIIELRKGLHEALEWNWLDDDAPNISDFIALYDSGEPQSINTLKARIEEEAINRCLEKVRFHADAYEIKSMPRKYSAEDE